jgi:hypothetical protein
MSPSPRERLTTEIVPGRYHQAVSNLAPVPSEPPPWPPALPPPRRRQWPMFAFLMVALLVTLGVAIVGWFRPVPAKPPPAPTYSNQQVADAKVKVCAAFDKVHQAVRSNFARDQGTDPNQRVLVAVTGQEALLAGSVHLQTTLSEESATPADLATAVRKLVDVFQSLTVDYLNGHGSPKVDPSLRAGDEATLAIQGLCK